jgi:transcriptional regulator with XRE-family HTH domain
MGARERRADRGRRIGREIRARLGTDLRTARLMAAASQDAVADVAEVPRSTYGQLERIGTPGGAIDQYAQAAAALGLRLWFGLYPDGEPVRDAPQLRLEERFRHRLHPSLRIRTEVLMGLPNDMRAWDMSVTGADWSIRVEAESRLYDVQAQTRRIELKRHDSGVAIVILLVADTATNRRVLREHRGLLREQFPLDTRAVMAALGEGRCPSGSGIVIL